MQGTQLTADGNGPTAGGEATTAGATRVLVVDESPLFRTAVAVMLEEQGYAVTAAGDSGEALARLPGADVVLFDLDLTGFDGTRLLAALSRDGQEGRPRRRAVVALTA